MSRIESEWWSRAFCCGYACIFYYYDIDERVQDAIHKTKLKIHFFCCLNQRVFCFFNKCKWSKCKQQTFMHSIVLQSLQCRQKNARIENHWNSFMTKMIMCVSFWVFHVQSADDLHLLCFVQIIQKLNKSRTVTVFCMWSLLLLYLIF